MSCHQLYCRLSGYLGYLQWLSCHVKTYDRLQQMNIINKQKTNDTLHHGEKTPMQAVNEAPKKYIILVYSTEKTTTVEFVIFT